MATQHADFPAGSIAAAQREMRLAYYGGAPGMLTSAIMWLAAAVAAVAVSPQKAVWTLFVGGMFIHPLSLAWNKAIGRPASHTPGNPCGALALATTAWMILMMPLAYGASRLRTEWFFPAMLLIIGGRYLTFAPMFGDRTYRVFGAAIEAGFAVAIFAATRAEVAASSRPAPGRPEADAIL